MQSVEERAHERDGEPGRDVPTAGTGPEDHPPGPHQETPPVDPPAPDGPTADAADEGGKAPPAPTPTPATTGWSLTALFRRRERRPRGPRPHPYADEPTGRIEARIDPWVVTIAWLTLATVFAIGGYLLQVRYGYFDNEHAFHPDWEAWTRVPLFAGLALLGFGFVRKPWARWLTMAGWVLFAAYWALTARDLYVKEGQDVVNFVFAGVGVYLFTYLAYHELLSLDRRVDNRAVHFLNIVAFVAAGSYFLIDKVTPFRVWLINVVGGHTNWMLNLFGQGSERGLEFIVDKSDSRGPVTFYYPDTVGRCPDGSLVAEKPYPSGMADADAIWDHQAAQCMPPGDGTLDQILFYAPGGEHLAIVTVSIILACTAIQSIMLFVGLFMGTRAPLQKKLVASVVVGALVYVLNLVRNTGIIWFYGQGHASFWIMHNLIGKGGSLIAMILIAVLAFRWFPELLRSLFDVLDLQHRDGPVERALRMGRKRPEAQAGNLAEAT